MLDCFAQDASDFKPEEIGYDEFKLSVISKLQQTERLRFQGLTGPDQPFRCDARIEYG